MSKGRGGDESAARKIIGERTANCQGVVNISGSAAAAGQLDDWGGVFIHQPAAPARAALANASGL
jgi:hypothetical protein